MRKNTSVIILAFSVLGMNSQGATRFFSPDKSALSTSEILQAFSPNSKFEGITAPVALKASLLFIGSGDPPTTIFSHSRVSSAQAAGQATSLKFEAPLPFPDSGQPPAFAARSVLAVQSPTVVLTGEFEAPLPFPDSGQPPAFTR